MRDKPPGAGKPPLALWRKLTNRSAWGNLFFRGNRFFLAFGGLYVRSPRWTSYVDTILRNHIPQMAKGAAFVRWGVTRTPQNSAVLIDGVGRFGNSIAQVLNALEIAHKLESPAVLYHRFDAMRNESVDLGDGVSLERVKPFRCDRRTVPKIMWRTSAITPSILFCQPCEERFNKARAALREATGVQELLTTSNQTDRELTIHVRGGDVFSEGPEEMYGQPPWAFYLRVLESQRWERVVVVSEDDRNPVVALIEKWCLQNDVKSVNAGGSFSSAVEAISRGRNLVSATGTFLPAIAYLSGGERVLFQFHVKPSPFVCSKNTTVKVVKDRSEHYVKSVMSHNWENSEPQKILMVSYPLENLSDLIGEKA